MIKLRSPLKQAIRTQAFGKDLLYYENGKAFYLYKRLGLNGHNGIDFALRTGTDVYAAHRGIVTWAGEDGQGGISVTILNKGELYKTIYYHLSEVLVNKGEKVNAGDIIGLGGNSGRWTTGAHLHFGLKRVDDEKYNTTDYSNGYKGAIDPSPYFVESYNGKDINPKDAYKSRCYHRYYRGRPKGGYWIEKYRVVPALIRRWKRLPNNEEINAAVYGGWDVETIENPAMYIIWSQLKKDEYLKGLKPINYYANIS